MEIHQVALYDPKHLRDLIDKAVSSIEEARDAVSDRGMYGLLDEYYCVRYVGGMSSAISTLLRIRKFVVAGKLTKGREAKGKCPVCDGLVNVTVFGEGRMAELERANSDLQMRLEAWHGMHKKVSAALDETLEILCPGDFQRLREMGEIR